MKGMTASSAGPEVALKSAEKQDVTRYYKLLLSKDCEGITRRKSGNPLFLRVPSPGVAGIAAVSPSPAPSGPLSAKWIHVLLAGSQRPAALYGPRSQRYLGLERRCCGSVRGSGRQLDDGVVATTNGSMVGSMMREQEALIQAHRPLAVAGFALHRAGKVVHDIRREQLETPKAR